MSHLIFSEIPRRTLLVSMFVVALLLSVVLYGATGSAEKKGNSDFRSQEISSGRNLALTQAERGPRPSVRRESVSSFFSSRLQGGSLLLPLGSTTTVNTAAQSPGIDAGCTLSSAIIAANTAYLHDPTDDGWPACGFPGSKPAQVTHTIILPAGTYTLGGEAENGSATGLPVITSNLIIEGAGAATTIIERNPNAAAPFRLIALSNQGSLALSGVTLRGGRSDNVGGAVSAGGPIILNNVVFTDNTAPNGGGAIFAPTLTIKGCTFTGNQSTNGGGGGAIFYAQGAGANVTITDSTFINNTAINGRGGAVWTSGSTAISGSTFDNNTTGTEAGAIAGGLYLTIKDSIIINNHANEIGGISRDPVATILGGGTESLTIDRCKISNNTSNHISGGVFIEGGSGNITNSTISGNIAGLEGGGIFDRDALLNLTNDTIDGNTAARGGGISYQDGTEIRPLTLNNVTITDNHATSYYAGGLYRYSGDINFKNTIIALNTISDDGFAPDIYAPAGLTSLGYNLVGIKDGGPVYTDGPGDQTGSSATPLDPLLGALQDNGGPTFTRALLAGSTAIDAGNPAAPGSGGNSCAAADQLGTLRPKDGDSNGVARCDIGAFEVVLPQACATPPSGMVGWWAFDGNADDIQGGNQALLFGGPSFVAGKVQQSLSFDGLDDYAKVPQSSAINVGTGDGLTFDAWINIPQTGTARPLIEWNSGAGIEGVHVWMSADFGEGGQGPGSIFVNLTDTLGTHHIFSSAPNLLAPAVWQHVAVTYDKTSGVAKIYLNGSIVAQQTLGTFTPQTTTDLYFGYRPVGVLAGRRFLGNLDEVELFNRALSDADIQSIYDADSAGKCKPAPSPSPSPTPSPTPAVINITEQINVLDTPTLLPSAMIGVNEQINVHDTPTLLPSAMIGINEQIHVLDTPTLLPSAMIGVNEQIHVVDAPTLLPAAMIGVFENISVFDLPTVVPMAVSLKTVAGTNVTVQSGGVAITFSNVTAPGITTITPISPASAGQLPGGYLLGNTGLAFDITTTAKFSGPIKISFTVPSDTTQAAFNKLRILHYENGVLVDRTTNRDFLTKRVWATVTSLSPFVVVELATEPRLILQDVFNDVSRLRDATTDKQDQQKLDEIIKVLTEALDATSWIDPTHLQPNRGAEVLNKMKDAIQKLSDLIESKKSRIPDPVLQNLINRLLQDPRLLAQTAIIDANSADGKLMEIAKADEALSQGDAEAAAGKYDQAMDDYRDAWLHAQKAIS